MAKTTKAIAPQAITRDDWLAAIAETSASRADQDPDLLSYAEFQALMKITYGTALRRTRELVAAGRAIKATKRTVTPDGRLRTVVAFRLKK